MILLRSIIFFILFVLSSLIFSFAIITVGLLLSYKNRSRIANYWGLTNIWLVEKICGLKYEIKGLENIPDSACIILSKHQSTWDTLILRSILPPEQAWVLKKELLQIPFFGWGLSAVQAIGIDRNAGRKALKQIIRLGSEHLEKGHYVIIYPEGTRVAPGEHKKYGISGAYLAQKSQFPIIPVAHNAGVFWRRLGLKKYPGTIQVIIGPLIETKGLKSHEINRRVEEWIESTMETLPQSINK